MWKCKKCGTEVDDELAVCWSCGTTIDGVEDPNFFREPEETAPEPVVPPGHQLVTILTCGSLAEAEAAKVLLESQDIPVFLGDAEMGRLLGSAIGIKVQVADMDVARALEALGEPQE